jgi:hypothetical protein
MVRFLWKKNGITRERNLRIKKEYQRLTGQRLLIVTKAPLILIHRRVIQAVALIAHQKAQAKNLSLNIKRGHLNVSQSRGLCQNRGNQAKNLSHLLRKRNHLMKVTHLRDHTVLFMSLLRRRRILSLSM